MRQKIVLLLLFCPQAIHGYDYDHIIIGGGTAGLAAAKTLHVLKKKIALIDKGSIGGSRLWSGDIPTKTFIKVANMVHQIQHCHTVGLPTVELGPINIGAIFNHVALTADKVANLDAQEHLDDATLLQGEPVFIDCHTIRLNDTIMTADKFIIATGASPAIPEIPGLEMIEYLTSSNFFNQTTLPSDITIVGGGPLGTEMAIALAKLGIKITLILKYKAPLPTFDQELVTLLVNDMLRLNITIKYETTITRIEKNHDGDIVLHLLDKNLTPELLTTKGLYIALNRVAATAGLGLEAIGIVLQDTAIKVNGGMQTSVSNIYACGDVIGGSHLLNRVAYYQAKIAAYNSSREPHEPFIKGNYAYVSKIIFSDPPLASVGLTEEAAKYLYQDRIKIFKCSYDQVDRSYIDGSTIGLAKAVCLEDGTLIGLHIYGKQSGELLDRLPLGKKIQEQFGNYINELYIFPSYNDLLWKITEAARNEYFKEHQSSWYEKLITALGLS